MCILFSPVESINYNSQNKINKLIFSKSSYHSIELSEFQPNKDEKIEPIVEPENALNTNQKEKCKNCLRFYVY